MSKIYVIMADFAFSGEPERISIEGVYDNKEMAQLMFKQMVENVKTIDKNNGYDSFEEDETSYNAWLDGEYNWYHSTLTLGEYELNKTNVLMEDGTSKWK